MQKALQKFTSAFLAANMIFSIVATNFVAYAEETPNVLPVSEEVLAGDAVSPGEQNTEKIKKIYIYLLTPLANCIEW